MCCDVKELNPAPRDAGYTLSGTKALTEIMVLQYKTASDLKVIVKSTTVLLQRNIRKYTLTSPGGNIYKLITSRHTGEGIRVYHTFDISENLSH